MTKFILLLAVALSTISINAAGVKFGLKLGVAFSKVENTNGERTNWLKLTDVIRLLMTM